MRIWADGHLVDLEDVFSMRVTFEGVKKECRVDLVMLGGQMFAFYADASHEFRAQLEKATTNMKPIK